MTSITM
jgi:hypothetical protein